MWHRNLRSIDLAPQTTKGGDVLVLVPMVALVPAPYGIQFSLLPNYKHLGGLHNV